jgi:hypothetical protein
MSPCDRYNPKKKVSCQILSIRLSKWERYNYKVCIYIFNKWTLASTSHKSIIGKYWVSEWLLFNANSAIFQLYHCENTSIFNEMMTVCIVWSWVWARNGSGTGQERVKPKIIKLVFVASPLKHAALKRKSKDWFAQNRDNIAEWGNMSIHGLLFQWANTIKIQLSMLLI